MKKKEIGELLMKPETELNEVLRETRARASSLELDRGAGKLKNFRELRDLKKQAARILTALSARKYNSQKER